MLSFYLALPQPTFTCSNPNIEKLEKGVNHVQS